MPEGSIVLFVIVPLAGSFFTLLEKIWPDRRITKPAVVLVFFSCLLFLLFYAKPIFQGEEYRIVLGNWGGPIGIIQAMDGLAWVGLLFVYVVTFFALIFAFSDKTYDSSFYFFSLILTSGMAGVILAADLFNLFVCLEIVGISAYILIAYAKKERAILASFKYLLLSSLGISVFLLGIFGIYRNTGSLLFSGMAEYFSSPAGSARETPMILAALIAGLGVRTAFIPFHTWLPEAHSQAPHPVSALLSGVVIKVTFIAVWRLAVTSGSMEVRVFLLWSGTITALVGVFWALMQKEIKVLLAWHSVSQMGYIIAGFGAGTLLSISGSLFHMLNHALFKSLLFLSLGMVIILTGEYSLKRIRGLGRKHPLLALVFAFGALSIAGIPPLNGFVSKKLIMVGLKEHPVAYWSLWITSIGTLASFTKLSALFWKKQEKMSLSHLAPLEEADLQENSAEEVSQNSGMEKTGLNRVAAFFPLVVLSIFCLITGVFGRQIFEMIHVLIFRQSPSRVFNPWTMENLWETIIVVFLGVFSYFLVTSRRGEVFQGKIRSLRLSLDWTLLFLLAGFIFLGLTVFLLPRS